MNLPAGPIHIQRDDLLHPVISGNKWRKLTGWLERARQECKSTLLTFGGAYSNHLVATACLAAHYGFRSIGILRGDEAMANPYLNAARGYGMTLWPVPREVYRDKAMALDYVRSQFHSDGQSVDWSGVLVIPQGGSGLEGHTGFAALISSWQDQGFTPQTILHASATGTTATGLALALAQAGLTTQVVAVPVLHNLPEQQAPAIFHDVSDRIQWLTGFECGGYAKSTAALRLFCQDFTARHQIPCGTCLYRQSPSRLDATSRNRRAASRGPRFSPHRRSFGFRPAPGVVTRSGLSDQDVYFADEPGISWKDE